MNEFFNELWLKYKDTPGWLTKEEAYILWDQALKVPDLGAIVEIGSWKGKSSIFIAMGIKCLLNETRLYCIDPFTGSDEHQETGPLNTFDKFIINIKKAKIEYYIIPIKGYSTDVVIWHQIPNNIDMLFIDGDHSYPGIKSDFNLYFPKLKVGGVMLFHDTIWWRGVARLMREEIFFNPKFVDL